MSEWRAVVRLLGEGAPPWWRAMSLGRAAMKMARSLASGPVPKEVWRDRMRICLRCPIYDAELKACRKRHDERLLGCLCYVPFLALSAAPTKNGCWAHQIAENVGWPAYRYPTLRARLRSIFQFLVSLRSGHRAARPF